jgi:hypothetical protein
MPMRKPPWLLALLLLSAVRCLAHQAVHQEAGKVLFPPSLIATGDNLLTGFSIASLPSIPFSASIEAENTAIDADGNAVLRRFHTKIARDSHGRTRIDTDNNPEGGPVDLRWLNTSIYDAVSNIDITLFAYQKLALRRKIKPASSPTRPPARSRHPILIEPPELSGLQDSQPQPDIRREELSIQLIDGVLLRHGRETSNYPAGFAGLKEPYATVTDYWYSQELQAFVLIKQVGPNNTVHTLRLTNVSRDEPHKSQFEIPHGYQVVEAYDQQWHSYGYCPVP